MTILPDKLVTPAAWYGPEIAARSDDWIIHLTARDIAELDAAIEHATSRHGDDIAAITAPAFPLEKLGQTLTDLRSTLIAGHGFALIRGFPIDRYSLQQAATVFFGLGAHLGHARSQNAAGHLLGHVRDLGKSGDDVNARIYQTHERQTFHTDSCDVVALLCLKQAKAGGDSLLVSAETIYNEILARRPDLLPCLFDAIATDRRGEVPDGMKPFFEIPVFNWENGRLTVMYQRQYIDSAQRFPDAMRLTDKHIEALDLFDELANDPALNMQMRLKPGDMQFVYNHALLHDRMAFEDWPEPERRRHLLRLWLSIPGDRPLPACYAERFGVTTIGDRGGIIVEGTELSAPLDG